MRTTRSPTTNDIDIHIGQRIRAQRLANGMTIKQLADELGITFQQVQRYEKGVDRVACSRLYQIANVLEVSTGAFFPTNTGAPGTNVNGVVHPDKLTPDTIKMLRAFKAVSDGKRRALLIDFVESSATRRPRSVQDK